MLRYAAWEVLLLGTAAEDTHCIASSQGPAAACCTHINTFVLCIGSCFLAHINTSRVHSLVTSNTAAVHRAPERHQVLPVVLLVCPTTWMPTVRLRGPSSSTNITDCSTGSGSSTGGKGSSAGGKHNAAGLTA